MCNVVLYCRLSRTKKKAQGEVNATAISNLLPFMEYELHTQLMNKLKLRCMNALFGLRIQISVGENMLLGLAVSPVFECVRLCDPLLMSVTRCVSDVCVCVCVSTVCHW